MQTQQCYYASSSVSLKPDEERDKNRTAGRLVLAFDDSQWWRMLGARSSQLHAPQLDGDFAQGHRTSEGRSSEVGRINKTWHLALASDLLCNPNSLSLCRARYLWYGAVCIVVTSLPPDAAGEHLVAHSKAASPESGLDCVA